MKIRMGFVSNSSSSSFVISKKHLTELQIVLIKNYEKVGKMLGMDYCDGWDITEKGDSIEGWTIMDNFEIQEFFDKIGVDDDNVHYEGGG